MSYQPPLPGTTRDRRRRRMLTPDEDAALEAVRAQKRHEQASREDLREHVLANLSEDYPVGRRLLRARLNDGRLGRYGMRELAGLLDELFIEGRIEQRGRHGLVKIR